MTIRTAIVLVAIHAALKAQAKRINDLNVYPVPDGDTGTNMLLTLESVVKETSGKVYDNLEGACRAGARAALMGARGNSGVLLSQMIRGAAEVLSQKATLTAESFVEALEGAKERAYSSLRKPVEGTMLTVIKDSAAAARKAYEEGIRDLPGVVEAAAKEAHASVRRTPQQLKTLRDAGVVDAGGLGVAVILDGVYAAVSGREVGDDFSGEDVSDEPLRGHAHYSGAEERWGYCTEFIVTGFSEEPGEFERRIHEMGKSVVVVTDEDLVKVHLHTQDPGEALSYAGSFGRLTGVKVDDMEAQARERAASGGGEMVVVAASRGEGNKRLFESMGAVVVEGGQGANPSAADLARPIEQSGARAAFLLPNNRNIIPAAERVGELVEAEVHVLRTTTIAAGLATMVGYDEEGDPRGVLGEMEEILASLHSVEITRAVRSSRVEGREVPEGAYMALVDGRLRAVTDSVAKAALEVGEELVQRGAELITLLRGEDLDERQATEIADALRDVDDELEVEVRYGGQPLYPLQMVAE